MRMHFFSSEQKEREEQNELAAEKQKFDIQNSLTHFRHGIASDFQIHLFQFQMVLKQQE